MPHWRPRPSRLLAAALAAAALCGAGSQSALPCYYSVQKIAPPSCPIWGPMNLNPLGVNGLGEWAGSRFICDLVTEVPVRWSPGTGLVSMALPSGCNWARAAGINDRGTVVGTCRSTSGAQQHDNWACIWIDGSIVQIPPLDPSSWSAAYAVNNQDWVVGARWMTSSSELGFVWRAGEITYIDPTPFGRSTAEAWDVSDSGWVVGNMSGGQPSVAFRWKDGVAELLTPLPGAYACSARAVTETGSAAGWSELPDAESAVGYRQVPTVWSAAGVPSALPLLPGTTYGGCIGMTGQGVILGQLGNPTKWVVWIGGQVHEIKTLLNTTATSNFNARAIGRLGHIVGSGSLGQGLGTGAWICTPGAGPADLNGDCAVDGADLGQFLGRWGEGFGSPADLDYSGLVDGADLGILLGSWTAP